MNSHKSTNIQENILECLFFLPFGLTQQQISHLWKIGMFEASIYIKVSTEENLIEIKNMYLESPIFYLTKEGKEHVLSSLQEESLHS